MAHTHAFGSLLATALGMTSLLACSGAPAEGPATATPAPAESAPESTPEPAASAPTEAPAPAARQSARPAEWGYEGDRGPARWAELSPAYVACSAGVMQSPIDISSKGAAKQASFQFSYGKARVAVAHHEHVEDILDNGHTIQVTVEEGSTLTTAKATYALKQFHFHTPSENRLDGKSYPLEAHFVHQSAAGDFAVVAVFFNEGKKNDNLQKLIERFPAQKGENKELGGEIDLAPHLPAAADTFHFLGSFTTPPCTENVEWIVYRTAHSASKDQIAAFASRLGSNNRPTQDLRARPISINRLEVASP